MQDKEETRYKCAMNFVSTYLYLEQSNETFYHQDMKQSTKFSVMFDIPTVMWELILLLLQLYLCSEAKVRVVINLP